MQNVDYLNKLMLFGKSHKYHLMEAALFRNDYFLFSNDLDFFLFTPQQFSILIFFLQLMTNSSKSKSITLICIQILLYLVRHISYPFRMFTICLALKINLGANSNLIPSTKIPRRFKLCINRKFVKYVTKVESFLNIYD